VPQKIKYIKFKKNREATVESLGTRVLERNGVAKEGVHGGNVAAVNAPLTLARSRWLLR
jgi:hypothetical protein